MIWSTKANCLTTTPEWQKHETQILSCSECSFILFRYSFPQGTQLVCNVLGEQQMLLHWWNYSPQAVIGLIARNYILFKCRWCYHRKYRGASSFTSKSLCMSTLPLQPSLFMEYLPSDWDPALKVGYDGLPGLFSLNEWVFQLWVYFVLRREFKPTFSDNEASFASAPYYPEYAWRFRWCIHIALTSVNRNWYTLIPLPFYFQIIHSNAKVNNAFPFHLMCGFKSPSAKSNGQTKGSLRFIAFQCIVEMQKTKDNFTPGWRWLPWNSLKSARRTFQFWKRSWHPNREINTE